MTVYLSLRRYRVYSAAALLAAALVAYANAFQNDFVWDDVSSILLHEHVQDPAQFTQLFREDQHPFGRGQGNFYRPLTAASFMAEFQLAGPPTSPESLGTVAGVSPFVFHFGNVLWHAAAAILVFALLGRLGAPRPVQFATALLFAVHPIHTEAVTYISGRADMLAATFMLLGLWCAHWVGPRGIRPLAVLASGLAFAAALLSKESAMMGPVLLALVALVRPQGAIEEDGHAVAPAGLRALRAPLILAFAMLGIYVALRATILNFAEPSDAAVAPLTTRLAETGQAFALYLKLLVVPTGLHMERTLDGAPGWLALVGYAALAATAIGAATALRKGQRRIACGLLWFIITWLPISGLFPLNAPMAEHWMYVPYIGLIWALSEAVYASATTPQRAMAAAVAVWLCATAGLALTADRNRDWRDNEAIYRATLAYNPDSIRVNHNLAITHELSGNPAAARRAYETYLDLMREAKADPNAYSEDELQAHLYVAEAYRRLGEFELAQPHYAVLLAVGPDGPFQALTTRAALGMGKVLYARGQFDEAARLFNQALSANPALRAEMAELPPAIHLL